MRVERGNTVIRKGEEWNEFIRKGGEREEEGCGEREEEGCIARSEVIQHPTPQCGECTSSRRQRKEGSEVDEMPTRTRELTNQISKSPREYRTAACRMTATRWDSHFKCSSFPPIPFVFGVPPHDHLLSMYRKKHLKYWGAGTSSPR